VEICFKCNASFHSRTYLRVQDQTRLEEPTTVQREAFLSFASGIHSFHNLLTALTSQDPRKTGNQAPNQHLSAKLLGQFVEHPVQIFVILSSLFNFLDGVKHGGVVLASKLAPDFRKRRFG
jgi:hypothetical protein